MQDMVAGARAISQVATLAGNTSLSQTWSTYAEGLYSRMQEQLYSAELNFWIDVVEGTKLRCEGRELIGYFREHIRVDEHILETSADLLLDFVSIQV